jgi:hypothetical protein
MRISIKPLAVAAVLLFAADPIVWAQSAAAPKSPPDITGRWVLELSGQYGNCAGPIDINPRGDSGGAGWAAIYAMTCDGDSKARQQRFEIHANAAGSYHFSGSGEHPDIFDLNWTQDGKALAGSGSFANQPLSAAMHK